MVLSTESSDEHFKYLYKFKLENEDARNCYLSLSRNSRNFKESYKAKLPMAGDKDICAKVVCTTIGLVISATL